MIKLKTKELEIGAYVYNKSYISNNKLELSVKLQYQGNDLHLINGMWGYYSITKNELETEFVEVCSENKLPKLSDYQGNNHGYITLDISFNDENVNAIETKLKDYLKDKYKSFKNIEFV